MLLTSLLCLRLRRCIPGFMYNCYSPGVMMVACSHLHLGSSAVERLYTQKLTLICAQLRADLSQPCVHPVNVNTQ